MGSSSLRWELALMVGAAAVSCRATLDLTEPPPVPEYRIAFDPPFQSGFAIMLGGSDQVQARVLDRGGRTVTPDDGPTFHSSNPASLTVTPDGHFTAVGVGGAAIIATARVGSTELTAGIQVSTVCTAEIGIVVEPASVTLDVGQGFTPSMRLTTCGGRLPVAATFSFSVSDGAILSVNPVTGEVLALRSGTAQVIGRASVSGLTGSVAVTVR
jgi:uncharacterized protein YjdB